MTEHFTRKEAVALASTIAENDDYEFNLVNAAVNALEEMKASPAALPVGELTAWIATKDQYPPEGVRVFWLDENSNRVGYDTWAGGDYIWNPTHWMHIPATAAARSQPTTEESLVVAGAQPVREPLSSEKLNELWVRVCGTAGGFRPFARAIEAAHGITKKGEQ